MSSAPPLSTERDALAAEYALGLLEGQELANARELERTDPAFRVAVDRWNHRFAPLYDGVAPVEPAEGILEAIDRQIGPAATQGSDNIVVLRRRLARWRVLASGSTALAASLALALLIERPGEIAPPAPRSAPMVAMIEGGGGTARLVAAWNAADRRLMVIPAVVPPADAAHSHELWLIPADGKPRSMGVMPDGTMRVTIDEPMAGKLREGAMLAVSLEPAGGSPGDGPSGPVLASGKLTRA